MSTVRFAVVCDVCHQHGEEYQGGLSCAECQRDVCEKCATYYDPDPPGRAFCTDCSASYLEWRMEAHLKGADHADQS